MRIRSVACSMPERIVTNDEVLAIVERESSPYLKNNTEKLLKRFRKLLRISGTEERRWRSEGEFSRDFAKKAVAMALERAELKPLDIDLLLYVGVGRGWLEPCMATFFQHECGIRNATGFDILDACLSWLRALHISYNFLKNGVYKNILILNAEFNYEFNSWATHGIDEVDYRFAQMTIGEAATAMVLSSGDSAVEPFFVFRTDPALHDLCKIPLPQINAFSDSERCPRLDPLVFFAYSTELMFSANEMIPNLYFDTPEFRKRGCDILFGHSASKKVMDHISRRLGYLKQTVNLYNTIGNVVSASIPAAMAIALEQGRLERGMEMLLVMGSAGFSAGIAHMVY